MPSASDAGPSFNAVILAGGRSSRLGGRPKALLQASGRTLLAGTLAAASGAAACAVAGPPGLAGLTAAAEASRSRILLVREDPPFAGPAAGVAAGLAALSRLDTAEGRISPDWTLVLACDMPFIAGAVERLLAAARADEDAAPHSLLAVDGTGQAQPLAGLYRTGALTEAIAAADGTGGLRNLAMRRLLARVQWKDVAVPAHSTADIDTWEDASRWSVAAPAAEDQQGPAASN
ncbi:molybdenum cofactor guanylyltransferase [Arthrobacter jiangjiafuii]|uniref:molybdenum cofactor guanylyltransferase n=1 Tax=Arthrobacter jiangjiafuii TaxID=2817475 RepID=UPI001F469A34|nr:NTP transferase domain-containing protein [Arthrobacter jiangjiafuii]